MDILWFSPLTPAVFFLGGALLVATFFRWLPRSIQVYISLLISLLVFVALLSRVIFRLPVDSFTPADVFSGWGFGVEMTMRVDGLGMAFLFIPVLLLVASFWAQQVQRPVLMLALAGAAAPVFVAANGISFSYALLFFDIIGCGYWLINRHRNLALARLFLAVLTTGALMMAALETTAQTGSTLLSFALWFRVGLFPFVEISAQSKQELSDGETMIWLALSTAVGVYVAARFLPVPLPPLVMGLMVLLMLLNGWLSWLEDPQYIHVKLLRMILIQPSLALLIAPISPKVSITQGIVYTLSLGSLWLMPSVGRPNLAERHWLWVYTAPFLTTLSLLAFPATFGWIAADRVYADLILSGHQGVVAAVLLAEGISLSALYHYWARLLRGEEERDIPLQAALVLAVPFLVPWVAGLTFSVVTGLDLNSPDDSSLYPMVGGFPSTWVIVLATWLLALVFGYKRTAILVWLRIRPAMVEPVLDLTWLWPYLYRTGEGLSRGILRLKSILEGAYYLGWALLIGLAGILVVILS